MLYKYPLWVINIIHEVRCILRITDSRQLSYEKMPPFEHSRSNLCWKRGSIEARRSLRAVKIRIGGIFTVRPWKQAVVRGIWRTHGFRQCAIPRIFWWLMMKMPPESPWNVNAIVLHDTEDFDMYAFNAKYLHVVCDTYI